CHTHRSLSSSFKVLDLTVTMSTDMSKRLYDAARKGDFQAVKAALENGADINWGNPNDEGRTPLWIASHEGRELVIKKLLASGADINKANNRGHTPLWVANNWGKGDNEAVVDILKEAGGRE
ncbi:unnamed protein product, partial [Meganyctiphanes norvegica]